MAMEVGPFKQLVQEYRDANCAEKPLDEHAENKAQACIYPNQKQHNSDFSYFEKGIWSNSL